jgi:hypothetical protein
MTLLLIKVKLIFFFKLQNSISSMMSTLYERFRSNMEHYIFFNDKTHYRFSNCLLVEEMEKMEVKIKTFYPSVVIRKIFHEL